MFNCIYSIYLLCIFPSGNLKNRCQDYSFFEKGKSVLHMQLDFEFNAERLENSKYLF